MTGCALTLAIAAGAGVALAAPPPLDIYGKLPFIESAALSPDGARLAYGVTDGERRTIVVRDMATNTVLGGLNAGLYKIREIQWAGDHHLIVTASATGYVWGVDSAKTEWFMALDYDIAKRKEKNLLSNIVDPSHQNDSLNTVYGRPQVRFENGRPYAIVEGQVFVDQMGRVALFKVDLDDDDKSRILFQGFPHTTGYAVSVEGTPLAETEYDAKSGRWVMKRWAGRWIEVDHDVALIEQPTIEGLGRDPNAVAVAFSGAKENVIRELSADGKTWSAPTPEADALVWDPVTGRLIGRFDLDADEARYTFFDPADMAAWKAIRAAYPGSEVRLVSFTSNHRKVIVRVDSPQEGPSYAFVDLDKHSSVWIGDEYQGLNAKDIALKRPIAFKAKDGLDLTGYLTLPPGRTAKALPLVVFPHGGPAARDEPGFDWWAQAMASRGYAVLQVNYRGSSGFTWDFMAAGFGQWGRKMQTDLSDGVRDLVAKGMVDPGRVCIVGASYGGYAALAGATLDPGVYRCAASIAGPSDLRRMIDLDKLNDGDQGAGVERYWLRFMGGRDGLAAISPALQAAKVTIPILLVHGRDDTVVAYEQSQIMADALRKAGKPVEFVTLAKEDHWLSRGATRLQMLQAVMAFLAKNNPAE